MAATLSQLSACVTRILYLTGFPKELKTRDIQAVFSEWENTNGGFKIKWIDDTSLLIVFNDATVAKRAYLHTLAFPPAIFTNSSSPYSTVIKPYDGDDAQDVIKAVNSRQHGSGSRGHGSRHSVAHGRGQSVYHKNSNNASTLNGNGSATERSGSGSPHDRDREPSPTLPNIPSHPTLNALISSSLSGVDASVPDPIASDPAILAAQPEHGGPRIGDPGKRMLGAALGVRHPSLGPRVVSGAPNGMAEMQRAMSGLVVAE